MVPMWDVPQLWHARPAHMGPPPPAGLPRQHGRPPPQRGAWQATRPGSSRTQPTWVSADRESAKEVTMGRCTSTTDCAAPTPCCRSLHQGVRQAGVRCRAGTAEGNRHKLHQAEVDLPGIHTHTTLTPHTHTHTPAPPSPARLPVVQQRLVVHFLGGVCHAGCQSTPQSFPAEGEGVVWEWGVGRCFERGTLVRKQRGLRRRVSAQI